MCRLAVGTLAKNMHLSDMALRHEKKAALIFHCLHTIDKGMVSVMQIVHSSTKHSIALQYNFVHLKSE